MNKPSLCQREHCTGCTACYNICPCKAIEMEIDEKGFWYPRIHTDICIGCLRCEKVCQGLHSLEKNGEGQQYFAFKHKDSQIRSLSSSGGFFTWLSDIILARGGRVYGAVFDRNFRVVHEGTDTVEGRSAMRGSKYVQSYLGDVFSRILVDLKEEKWVLFSGTPCQCEALLLFSGSREKWKRLVTLDFICEGVASPQVFEDFKYQGIVKNKKRGELSFLTFRDKNRYAYKKKPILARRLVMGFQKSNEKNTMEYVFDHLANCRYLDLLFSGCLQRECCLQCKFHDYSRISDFTCGDFHRFKGEASFQDGEGLSEVLVNTALGHQLWNENLEQAEYLSCSKEDVWQPLLTDPVQVDRSLRERFWERYFALGYKKATDLVMPKVYKRMVMQKVFLVWSIMKKMVNR